MSKLRAVSLFSNCGAGDVGYRDAGFRFDVMAELDPRRLDVCLLNHPGAEGVAGDLRKTWQTVIKKYRARAGKARPALLCACPPCQGMSSARSGKGSHDDAAAGSKDERNLLVTVVANVALELKPSLLVVENVPAFFTRKVHHPKDKKPVSAANYLITALADDYVAFPLVTDLCDFGVPQSRNPSFARICQVSRSCSALDARLSLGRRMHPTLGAPARSRFRRRSKASRFRLWTLQVRKLHLPVTMQASTPCRYGTSAFMQWSRRSLMQPDAAHGTTTFVIIAVPSRCCQRPSHALNAMPRSSDPSSRKMMEAIAWSKDSRAVTGACTAIGRLQL